MIQHVAIYQRRCVRSQRSARPSTVSDALNRHRLVTFNPQKLKVPLGVLVDEGRRLTIVLAMLTDHVVLVKVYLLVVVSDVVFYARGLQR